MQAINTLVLGHLATLAIFAAGLVSRDTVLVADALAVWGLAYVADGFSETHSPLYRAAYWVSFALVALGMLRIPFVIGET